MQQYIFGTLVGCSGLAFVLASALPSTSTEELKGIRPGQILRIACVGENGRPRPVEPNVVTTPMREGGVNFAMALVVCPR